MTDSSDVREDVFWRDDVFVGILSLGLAHEERRRKRHAQAGGKNRGQEEPHQHDLLIPQDPG